MPIAPQPLALLIDDSAASRDLVGDALVEIGFAVRQRTTAVGALAMIRALSPAIVLCDFAMPLMTGADLVHAIRRDPYVHATPVLLYSAADELMLARVAQQCVADAWCTKQNARAIAKRAAEITFRATGG